MVSAMKMSTLSHLLFIATIIYSTSGFVRPAPSTTSSSSDRLLRRRVIISALVRPHNNNDSSNEIINRRSALSQFFTASTAILLPSSVFAVDGVSSPPLTTTTTTTTTTLMASEFSESPTSDASIARLKYDGKIITPPPTAPAKDFDGNEAGSVGSSDEGTKTPIKGAATLGAVVAKSTSSSSSATFPSSTIQPKLFIPISADKLIVGSVVFLGLLAFTSVNDEDTEAGGAVAASGGSSSPSEPYGMAGGRNYFDDAGGKGMLDMNAAKTSGLVMNSQNSPPSPVGVEQQPKKVVLTAEAWSQVKKPKEKPKWKLEKPIPYGIQNSGKNPFIAEVLEYCVGGKVTDDCVDSLKGYLDNISDTGAAATNEEVTAVVGYLNSLGSSSSSSTSSSMIVEKRKVGLAFANYLDALSAGSAPPPSTAKAVKTYLDTLNGTAGAAFSARMKRERLDPLGRSPTIATVGRTPDPFDAVVATNSPDFAQYNTRLSSIEVRVSSLETKVDELPDRVFDKIEAWQSRQEGRMADEVRKIVNALSSVSAPFNPAPKDAAKPASPMVIMPASPLGSAIPERFGVPRASSVSVSRKSSYKFGGESMWKQATSDGEPNASMTPVVAPVTEKIRATPTATTATHESVKDVRSSVPKKYGVSGGTGWKTSKPKAGGGYLDNINR